uniref:ATP synthase subunit a n=1 Tax=Mimachlamys senatoria TaxID=388643 RepID=T1SAU5_9BIVA|nr:ATP synthase subunit 6 [Mimachlamys senatoria]
MVSTLSYFSYFNQFDWSFSLGSFAALCLPFFLLFMISNPIFMSAGLLESGFTWCVLSMSKFFLSSPFGKKAGGVHLMVCLVCVLLSVNLLGLIPFVLGVSTSASFVFFYALFFWGVGTLGSLMSVDGFLKGMWVKGGSFGLNLVVVISELLSWLIRPVVMGIRLLVNVMCGHVMLAIIGEMAAALVWDGHWVFGVLSVIMGCMIGFLEWLVMVVQAIVFVGLVGWSWSSDPKSPRSLSYLANYILVDVNPFVLMVKFMCLGVVIWATNFKYNPKGYNPANDSNPVKLARCIMS